MTAILVCSGLSLFFLWSLCVAAGRSEQRIRDYYGEED